MQRDVCVSNFLKGESFHADEFAEGTAKAMTVEGWIVKQSYETDAIKPPFRLAVQRNYENSFKQGGWSVVLSNEDMLTVRQTVNGQERWAQLSPTCQIKAAVSGGVSSTDHRAGTRRQDARAAIA